MGWEIIELTEIDHDLVNQIVEIEQDAFGVGGMTLWFITPFVRYGSVFVIVKQGKVLAVAEYMRDFNETSEAYLFGFTVKREVRSQGFGTALLTTAHARLKKKGINVINLTVDPQNEIAIKLYLKLGFRKIEFLPNEYGTGFDRLVMTLELA